MALFRKKKHTYVDPVEQTFNIVMKIIKDLSKEDFTRLKKGMDAGWQSYQLIRNVKTDDERENSDIDDSDRVLTKESEK